MNNETGAIKKNKKHSKQANHNSNKHNYQQ
jgi:hypothetical protein